MMAMSSKQWADAFMALDQDQLIALVVEAGTEPDWKEVFLAWLESRPDFDDTTYFTLLLAAKVGCLPGVSPEAIGQEVSRVIKKQVLGPEFPPGDQQ